MKINFNTIGGICLIIDEENEEKIYFEKPDNIKDLLSQFQMQYGEDLWISTYNYYSHISSYTNDKKMLNSIKESLSRQCKIKEKWEVEDIDGDILEPIEMWSDKVKNNVIGVCLCDKRFKRRVYYKRCENFTKALHDVFLEFRRMIEIQAKGNYIRFIIRDSNVEDYYFERVYENLRRYCVITRELGREENINSLKA